MNFTYIDIDLHEVDVGSSPRQLVLAHVSDTEPSSINLALENPQACRVLVAGDLGARIERGFKKKMERL